MAADGNDNVQRHLTTNDEQRALTINNGITTKNKINNK